MKMNFITAGIIAALLVPAAAQAQPGQHDRRVTTQQDHRDNRQVSNNRDDRRYDQRDNRQAQRSNDWRRDARYNNFRAPFSYQRFQAGSTMKPSYTARNYRMSWDNRWGLPRAGKNQSYVRHYNDLLLVNERNGKVVRVYRDMFRYR